MINQDLTGRKMRFVYPEEFEMYPEYREHSGQVVEVLYLVAGADPEVEAAYEVRADNGWLGLVYESELEDL